MHEDPTAIPYGYCHCGCGQKTKLARQTAKMYGWRKGKPHRFVLGHGNRRRTPDYLPEDRGYDTPCWIWQGVLTKDGYGRIRRDGRLFLAHRWVYIQFVGPIQEGLELDHLCTVRDCVNPAHLEPVTGVVNARRSRATKLTPDDVAEVRRLCASGESQSSVAARFGLGQSHVSRIARREVWRDAG